MRRVVIDENLPRSFGEIFRRHGFEIIDVRDQGLCGADDGTVFSFTKERDAALATADVKFANTVHLFESVHQGVFLIRLPTALSIHSRRETLDRLLAQLGDQSIENRIIVIAPGSLRIHGQHP